MLIILSILDDRGFPAARIQLLQKNTYIAGKGWNQDVNKSAQHLVKNKMVNTYSDTCSGLIWKVINLGLKSASIVNQSCKTTVCSARKNHHNLYFVFLTNF